MPINNYIYSTTVPSDLTGIYIPAIQRNIQALAGAAEQTAKKRGNQKTSLTFKKAKNQTKGSSNKTSRLIEETNAKKLHDLFNFNVNGVTVNPFDTVLQLFSPDNQVIEVSENLLNERRPTGLKWVDLSNSIPEDSWYSFLKEPLRTLGYNRFHNRDLLTAGERVVLPALMGAAGGTSVGAGGEASLNLLGNIGKWILGTELVDLSTKPFTGSSISLTASHYLPISAEGAHEAMILGAPGAVKGGKVAFDWGTMKSAQHGFKPAINRIVSNSINKSVDLGIINPEFLSKIEVPEPTILEPLIKSLTAILPWGKIWKQANRVANKVRKGEVNADEARFHVGIGYNGNKTNFPGIVLEDGTVVSTGVPTGTGRVTKVFDSRDPNLLLWNSPAIQAYESSVGKDFEPTINVSGAKNLNGLEPEILDEMIGRLSMAIDPLFRADLNPTNFRLSTNSGTPLNRSLLNKVALNLKNGENPIYEAGFNKANLPFNEKTVDVPLYKLKNNTAQTPEVIAVEPLVAPLITVKEVPLYPFEGPVLTRQQGVLVMDLVKNTTNPELRVDILKHYYPNLTDDEVNTLLGDLEIAENNSWMGKLGFHPMIVENARLKTLGDRMLLAQDFDLNLFGYPDLEIINTGNVLILRENLPFGGYDQIFRHSDGSQGGIFFTNDHSIRPILRPGDTGKVNRGVLVPMFKELKNIRLNPNFKGWTLYNDYMGKVGQPYNMVLGGTDPYMFGANNLSLDSNELLYDVGHRYNIPIFLVPARLEFNNMAFNNRDLTNILYDAHDNILNGNMNPSDMINVIKTHAYPYYDRIGAYRPVVGTRTGTALGPMPILGLKHGKKLIRRKC